MRGRDGFSLGADKYIFLLIKVAGGDLVVIHRAPGDAVVEFIGSFDFAYDVIDHITSNSFEGMTIVDKRKRIAYLSPIREKALGLSRGDAIGRPLRDVIANSNLDRVLTTGHAEIGHLHRTQNEELVVSRIPIKRDGNVIGAVGRIMFKGVKQLEEVTQRIKTLEPRPAKGLCNRWKCWSRMGVFTRIVTGLAAEAANETSSRSMHLT